MSDIRKFRRLIYGKRVELNQWATYELIPTRSLNESDYPASIFNKIIDLVRENGCAYSVIEISETIKESNCR